ncbi:MAG: hypothetical protein PHR82_09435 [Endomicrobiaceae bacterium]|nr:hypothetical protein [Endomicrobiaceae bacterium]
MKNIVFILCILFTLSSCAVFDYPKRFAGYSIANFENEKDGRFSFEAKLPVDKAYNKCKLFLFEKKLQTNFESKKKKYIVTSKCTVLFEYCLDSTEVAFFVHSDDNDKSTIEIVSNNSRLAKFIFLELQKYFS